MDRIAIYYRVSTDKQDLESQKVAIEDWLARRPKKPTKIHVIEDEGFSGMDAGRPGFKKLITMASKREIDAVVVYRLDRFSRDASLALRAILELDELGVGFVSVTQPILNLSDEMPFRRMLLAGFAEIAQLERDTIIIRVKAGLEAARRRGVKLGAPRKISFELQEKAYKLRSEGLAYKSIAPKLGISVGSVHRLVKGPRLCYEAPKAGATKEASRVGTPAKFTASVQEDARFLRSKGLSYREVAKELCISVASTHALITGADLAESYGVKNKTIAGGYGKPS